MRRWAAHEKVLGADREAPVAKGAEPVADERLVQPADDLVAVEEDGGLRLAQVLEEEGAAAHAVPPFAAVEGARLRSPAHARRSLVRGSVVGSGRCVVRVGIVGRGWWLVDQQGLACSTTYACIPSALAP